MKRQKGGKYELGEPKTERSKRTIVLPAFVLTVLQDHRKRVMAEGHGSTFVFCSTTGTPINPTNLLRRFHYPTLEKAKLPRITLHDLRHTAATLLARMGVHPKVAQDRLGHSTMKLTLELYTHADLEQQREAAAKLDERFGKQ
jgi:integrase